MRFPTRRIKCAHLIRNAHVGNLTTAQRVGGRSHRHRIAMTMRDDRIAADYRAAGGARNADGQTLAVSFGASSTIDQLSRSGHCSADACPADLYRSRSTPEIRLLDGQMVTMIVDRECGYLEAVQSSRAGL
jgi:hypothetical protein